MFLTDSISKLIAPSQLLVLGQILRRVFCWIDIKEVLLFPAMKPEAPTGAGAKPQQPTPVPQVMPSDGRTVH